MKFKTLQQLRQPAGAFEGCASPAASGTTEDRHRNAEIFAGRWRDIWSMSSTVWRHGESGCPGRVEDTQTSTPIVYVSSPGVSH